MELMEQQQEEEEEGGGGEGRKRETENSSFVIDNISNKKILTDYESNMCDKNIKSDKETRKTKAKKMVVIIKIKDKGKGIDKKIYPKLFEKFVTANNYDSGIGLGLFISKRIVEMHGGKIWAENNEDGPGAIFGFSLPLFNK